MSFGIGWQTHMGFSVYSRGTNLILVFVPCSCELVNPHGFSPKLAIFCGFIKIKYSIAMHGCLPYHVVKIKIKNYIKTKTVDSHNL